MVPIHGEMGSGNWSHCRWCRACDHYHGALYICDGYDKTLRARLRAEGEEFDRCLLSPKWIAEQLSNGIPIEAISIYRWFSGIEESGDN